MVTAIHSRQVTYHVPITLAVKKDFSVSIERFNLFSQLQRSTHKPESQVKTQNVIPVSIAI